MADEFDRFLGTQVNKISDTTGQLGRKGLGFSTLPSFTQDVIEIWDARQKLTHQDEGQVFVTGHPDYNLIDPLMLSYNGNESFIASGSIVDESVNENNGTFHNYGIANGSDTNMTYDDDNPVASGFASGSFNGSSSEIQVPYNSKMDWTTAGTIMAWVNFADLTGTGYIMSRYSASTSADRSYLFWKQAGDVRFYTTSSSYVAATLPSAGWHHVCGVWDGTNGIIYLDGVHVQTQVKTFTNPTANIGLSFGTDPTGTGNKFEGLVAHARIWTDEALTETRINNEMNSSYPISSLDKLSFAWEMNGNSNDTNFLSAGHTGGAAYTLIHDKDQYIETDSTAIATGSDEITIAAWCRRIANTSDTQRIVSYASGYGGGNRGPTLYSENGGKTAFGFRGDDTITYSVVTPTDMSEVTDFEWYHAVGRFKKNEGMDIFFNGSLYNSTSLPTDVTFINDVNTTRIGTRDSTTQNFNGQLENIQVYNYKLTDAEISRLYAGGSGINALEIPNLETHLQMDGNLNDNGTNTNIATWVGTGSFTTGKQYPYSGYFDAATYVRQDTTITGFPFSFSVQASVDTLVADKCFMSLVDPTDSSKYFAISYDGNTGKMQMDARDGGTSSQIRSGLIEANKFYNVVGVYASPTDRRFYVDGELVGSATAEVIFPGDVDTLLLGLLRLTSPTWWHRGKLGDARVYAHELSQTEIDRLYNEGLGIVDNRSVQVGDYPMAPNWVDRELVNVSNSHDYFPENFENNRFLDITSATGSPGNSTGVWSGDTQFISDAKAYYPMQGNPNDYNGTYNGTLVGGTSLTDNRFGTGSYAYNMDGTSDYISTSLTDTFTSEFTIAFWTRRISGTSVGVGEYVGFDTYLKGFWTDADGKFVLEVNSGGRKGSARYDLDTFFPANEWVFVAGVASTVTGELSLYKNGELLNQRTDISSALTTYSPFKMGVGEINGDLSDVYISDIALTEQEVAAMYSETKYKYLEDNPVGSYYIASGSLLKTDYIAYEDKIYKSLNVNINSEYVSTGSSATNDLDIVGIINDVEYPLTNNSTTSISNFSTDGIKIKITNANSEVIKLNNFRVKYTE